MYTLSEVAEFNEDGQIDGFQLGRETAIQLWHEKKVALEYRALFLRLYKRNWNREARKQPACLERMRRQLRESYRRHRKRRLKRTRETRKEAYETNPVVNTCEECQTAWKVPYGPGQPRKSRFCSGKCRDRARGRLRSRALSRGLRKMDIKALAVGFVQDHPGSSAAEIARGVDAGLPSLLTLLKTWTEEGLFTRTGKRPIRYERTL
jgi:hypothetical protein